MNRPMIDMPPTILSPIARANAYNGLHATAEALDAHGAAAGKENHLEQHPWI
jgi:hypothetical protein